MFWRFGGYANISTLDSILDKPDVTLEELLEESDLIQEVKAQNAKLIEFLRDDSRLERLLKYVTAPKLPPTPSKPVEAAPEEKKKSSFFARRTSSQSRDDDAASYQKQEDQRMRRACISCEILSAEVHSLYEALFANPQYLKEFWDYIRQDAPLDAVQAGYWSKVNESLLEKRPEDMVKFMQTMDDIVANMMRHVDNPVIMDLLLKLISLEKEQECGGIVDWLQSQNLVPHLLSFINASYPASTQTSAGDFMKAIITISANATSQDGSVIGPNELTRQLVSESCVSYLVKEMLKGGNPLTVGVGIIIEVIRKNNSDYDSETQVGPEPKSSDPIYLGTLLHIFATHVPDFMSLILNSQHTVVTDRGLERIERKPLKVAWGEQIEPLGFDRFKTCELMAELLHCSNMGLLNEKGSYAAIMKRDAERQRLKNEGRLQFGVQNQDQNIELGGSFDSSGFHQPTMSTPLGESPEHVRQSEAGPSDGEDFEKVSMPDPSISSGETNSRASNVPQTSDSSTHESDTTAKAASASSQPDTHSTSLLSMQLQADKQSDSPSGMEDTMDKEDMPPPLFSARSGTTEAALDPSTGTSRSEADTQSDISQAPTLTDADSNAQANLPFIETEEDGAPVIGDFLKIKFVENKVVPTILDFFFRFPWNNFLHNVVYDVVQQVFNGSMDRGHNRNLAIDLFETGRITDRIIEGQSRSDQAQRQSKMRLGYMGHLTLVAEEVVKFTERQPAEQLGTSLVSKITNAAWIHYVENVLTETRDRDNAILGGMRPEIGGGLRQGLMTSGNAPQTGSAALANAGLTSSGAASGLDSMDLATAGSATSISGSNSGSNGAFGGSSDDDDEDESIEEELGEDASGSGSQNNDEEAENVGEISFQDVGLDL